MRRTVLALILVVALVLLVAELAMDVTPADRRLLYLIFGVMALATFLAAVVSLRLATRFHSLRTSLIVIAYAAVVVTGAAVAVAAVTMFIEPHDLTLVLVAIGLGVGLGSVIAGAVARPLTADLEAISRTAERVGAGDLRARTGVSRNDELGRAAAALDETIATLEASEIERRNLLSAIGHDLRTPMGSMQAAVEALQDEVAPDPQAYLRGLALDLEHLRHLVDDLFLLARIESGRLDFSPVSVDIAELADEAVEAVTLVAARRQVALTVDGPGHVAVRGDPAALGRVLRNLLANAILHSPESGKVRVVIGRNGSEAITTVVDQGPGFPTEMGNSVFERFVRADDSRSRESGGTGLGLAIAKSIIEAHGGNITIEPGPGGRIRFSVPLG
ncbi:MAG TPA: HAMP domain-containing sensor histidine kinase [Acidimicrobiia bacterium]|nr:HAMP domain-containing sensor histidine kinase [Acidimicrobiia bacterium]